MTTDESIAPFLQPIAIPFGSALFDEICRWQFPDQFISRLLINDIPQRVAIGNAQIWGYEDASREIVGFGTFDICSDHSQFTDGKMHPHIPLLGVNPEKQGKGYGSFIVDHLIGEAVLAASMPGAHCCGVLFLEVYETSTRAIGLYERKQFSKITEKPIFDPAENKGYFIMARRLI